MRKLYIKLIDRWEESRKKEAEWLREHMFLGILVITILIIWKMIQNKLTTDGFENFCKSNLMPEDMIEARKVKAVDDTTEEEENNGRYQRSKET